MFSTGASSSVLELSTEVVFKMIRKLKSINEKITQAVQDKRPLLVLHFSKDFEIFRQIIKQIEEANSLEFIRGLSQP
jgi:hypothetical protein